MTRVIQIGARGELTAYWDEVTKTVRIINGTSCTLVIDGKIVNPGETV